jgi:hypothetical protein
MKSATPESALVTTVKQSLDKDPTDEERIIECFASEDQSLATIIVSAYVDQKRDLQAMREVMVKMQQKQEQTYELLLSSNNNKRITSTSLSRFFDLHPELLEGFNYDGEFILFKGEKLKPESNALLSLSIRLEDYFGTKEIQFKDLLIAIKRYFFKIQQQDDSFKNHILLMCEEYLNESKTRKRTRVPMKYIKTIVDLPLQEIKDLMYSIGYVEWKDKAGNLHYYPD